MLAGLLAIFCFVSQQFQTEWMFDNLVETFAVFSASISNVNIKPKR